MTIDEISTIAKMASKDKPIGDAYLDSLFDLADTAVYYRFMFYLVKYMWPTSIVELGVCTGRSTAHLAAAKLDCNVIGIDPYPQDVSAILDRYKNIELKIGSSLSKDIIDSVRHRTVDILFIDSLHEYDQVIAEYKAWLPKMKYGGVILFDDIHLDEYMSKVWEFIQLGHDSIELPHLHHSGFGAIIA